MSITNGQLNKLDNQAVPEKAGGRHGTGKPYQNRIKTPSVEAVELAD